MASKALWQGLLQFHLLPSQIVIAGIFLPGCCKVAAAPQQADAACSRIEAVGMALCSWGGHAK